jgi:tRNA(fMet)-specific endonuclease VapC
LARLILDTTILIAGERGKVRLDPLFDERDDVAIAAVTAAELLVGVELAGPAQRAKRESYVEDILRSLSIETYDLDVARAHASLLAAMRRAGRTRGVHDLTIAATALARARIVVTFDPKGFADLPGVTSRGP